MLQSVVQLDLWLPGRPVHARCSAGLQTPCVTHPCGLHGWWTKKQALAYARKYHAANPRALYVVGQVRAAGRVVEHERGFRAARAIAVSVDEYVGARCAAADDIMDRLDARYGLHAAV